MDRTITTALGICVLLASVAIAEAGAALARTVHP
jgi:hypothetical protein